MCYAINLPYYGNFEKEINSKYQVYLQRYLLYTVLQKKKIMYVPITSKVNKVNYEHRIGANVSYRKLFRNFTLEVCRWYW